MITHMQCLERYGPPQNEKAMVLFDVPTELEVGILPKKIYCNKDLVLPLTHAFKNIIQRGLVTQLKTWDGCFNIRAKKSGTSWSLHAWGLAIDINAAWNGFKKPPTMSKELVQCFKDAGFEWGGDWQIKDGMHFQLKEFPK